MLYLRLSSVFCFIVSCLVASPSLFSESCTASSYLVHLYLVLVRSSRKTLTTLWSSSTTATSFFICFSSSFLLCISILSSSCCWAVSYKPVIIFWYLSLWAVTPASLIPFSCSISNYSSSLAIVSAKTICFVLAYSTRVFICSSFILISDCIFFFFSLFMVSILWWSTTIWPILSILSAFSISNSWYCFLWIACYDSNSLISFWYVIFYFSISSILPRISSGSPDSSRLNSVTLFLCLGVSLELIFL